MHELRLAWGAATDSGLRAENQDHFIAEPPVFAVCDGMGGHADGSAASKAAVTRLAEMANAAVVDVEVVRTAVRAADDDVQKVGAGTERQSRPGTTVAGLALGEQDGEPVWLAF